MRYFIGVDLGLDGGIARVSEDGKLERINPMPTMYAPRKFGDKTRKRLHDIEAQHLILLEYLSWGDDPSFHAVLESIPTYIRDARGAMGALSIGRAEAIWQTLFTVENIPYESVNVTKWQRYLGFAAGSGKSGHRDLAAQIWPEHAKLFAPAGADGLADAALLAEYGRRTYSSEVAS